MFCSECGTQNPDTNQFCKNCGKPLPRRQPAAQPAVPPAQVPVAPVPQPVTAAAPPAPGVAPMRKRNWLGIVSLILGILSWGILTFLFAIIAVMLGIIALYLFRKATGRIGISSLIGIVLGIAAIIMTIMLA